MKSTRTGEIEARLQKQQAEVLNNRRILDDLRDNYRNELKAGKDVDNLTDKALRINGLQARQEGLDAAVEVTKEQLAESQKHDNSPEAKAGRKRISELSESHGRLMREAWQAANDLDARLQQIYDTAKEHDQLCKKIDGVNPNLRTGKRGSMMRKIHSDLSRWLNDCNGRQLKF